ncbi:MAG: hypothetical protein CW716_03675 [Candidatus Bathyarchaeum sp.]|nr:MAG: hypothetical protein CW716_03675 [Candidatus Bathyarchaeum sp.]
MHIKTVAAILVWLVVVLLLLNNAIRSEWILPIGIVLTIIAVLAYFSPRLKKGKKAADKEEKNASSDLIEVS